MYLGVKYKRLGLKYKYKTVWEFVVFVVFGNDYDMYVVVQYNPSTVSVSIPKNGYSPL